LITPVETSGDLLWCGPRELKGKRQRISEGMVNVAETEVSAISLSGKLYERAMAEMASR